MQSVFGVKIQTFAVVIFLAPFFAHFFNMFSQAIFGFLFYLKHALNFLLKYARFLEYLMPFLLCSPSENEKLTLKVKWKQWGIILF